MATLAFWSWLPAFRLDFGIMDQTIKQTRIEDVSQLAVISMWKRFAGDLSPTALVTKLSRSESAVPLLRLMQTEKKERQQKARFPFTVDVEDKRTLLEKTLTPLTRLQPAAKKRFSLFVSNPIREVAETISYEHVQFPFPVSEKKPVAGVSPSAFMPRIKKIDSVGSGSFNLLVKAGVSTQLEEKKPLPALPFPVKKQNPLVAPETIIQTIPQAFAAREERFSFKASSKTNPIEEKPKKRYVRKLSIVPDSQLPGYEMIPFVDANEALRRMEARKVREERRIAARNERFIHQMEIAILHHQGSSDEERYSPAAIVVSLDDLQAMYPEANLVIQPRQEPQRQTEALERPMIAHYEDESLDEPIVVKLAFPLPEVIVDNPVVLNQEFFKGNHPAEETSINEVMYQPTTFLYRISEAELLAEAEAQKEIPQNEPVINIEETTFPMGNTVDIDYDPADSYLNPNLVYVILEPVHRATISSQITAPVVSIEKEMGESFKAGEVLVRLDNTVYEANLEKAVAFFKKTKLNARMREQLFEDDIGSLTELKEAQAELATAKADLAIARKQLEATSIVAPYPGRMVDIHVHEYELAEANTPLIDIIGDEVLIGKMLIDASQLRHVSLGETIKIRFNEVDEEVTAKIIRIGAEIDPASATIRVDARIENSDLKLTAGMTGTAVLPNKAKKAL